MRYSILFFLPTLLLSGQSTKPPQPIAMPTDRVEDSYTIYSQLLGGGPLQLTGDQWIAISETTQEANSKFLDPTTCLQPPESDKVKFQEMLNDYQSRHEIVLKLEPKFHLNVDYKLVNKQDIDAITHSNRWSGPDAPEPPQKYEKSRGIIWLGQVYFDSDHEMAAVYIWSGCGSLCGHGQWMAFKKIEGQWKGQPWGRCSVMS